MHASTTESRIELVGGPAGPGRDYRSWLFSTGSLRRPAMLRAALAALRAVTTYPSTRPSSKSGFSIAAIPSLTDSSRRTTSSRLSRCSLSWVTPHLPFACLPRDTPTAASGIRLEPLAFLTSPLQALGEEARGCQADQEDERRADHRRVDEDLDRRGAGREAE